MFHASSPGMLRRPVLPTALWFFALTLGIAARGLAAEPAAAPSDADQLLNTYCGRCHNDEKMSGDWSLSSVSVTDLSAGRNLAQWEKILRMTSRGEMPPRQRPRPEPAVMDGFTHWLESSLDEYAAAHPDPGRATLRRLNRAEYSNAVAELLALPVDVSGELPADDSGYGFDNIADVLTLSPTLMERYLSVAGRLSRLATGLGPDTPFVTSHRVPKDGSIKNQGIPAFDDRSNDGAGDDLPINSRGGGAFAYFAPRDGEYEIAGYLNANTNNEVDRLAENRVQLRVRLKAGPHRIGITFRRDLTLDESVQTLRNTTELVVMPTQPPKMLPLEFVVDGATVGETPVPSYYLSPRFSQANFPRDVLQIDVEGPFHATGPGDTPSRRRIFLCHPGPSAAAETACARRIVASLARQAYRRPVTTADIDPLLGVYAAARSDGSFEQGISAAVEAILVSPGFLFVGEQDPPPGQAGGAPGTVHPITDLEFASRLSLFLWSSIPDEELLRLAARNQLRSPAVLEQQVARMLDDRRAAALTQNFAGQWLYLRNLDHQRPDVVLFPGFDTRLRSAMQRETGLFFASVVHDNRSILDFLGADYTFLNQRLAEHYGVAGVRGVALGGCVRGGIVTRGTSRAGQPADRDLLWQPHLRRQARQMDPGGSPCLTPAAAAARRAGAESHPRWTSAERARADGNAPRGSGVRVMPRENGPPGFALEHFDPVGAFRLLDAGRPVDASATMPDGTTSMVSPD